MANITITCCCPLCGQFSFVTCDEAQLAAYESGALAQEAFADMDIHTRESIISGMCFSCQESFFEEDEDEDDCDGICALCSHQDECVGSDIL